MEIYNKYSVVPEEAQKPISAGRLKGYTDINPQWRIQSLTEAFGMVGIGWYYDVVNQWSETVGNEVCAFVNINLYVKVDGEWSKPINGIGGSKLATMERNGLYVSDECYKMATTDAISVACKQLGFGADVYWKEGRSKYRQTADEQEPTKEVKPQTTTKKVEPASEAKPKTEEIDEASARDFLLQAVKEHYEGQDISEMLKWANSQSIDEFSTAQLSTIYNNRVKK